MALDSLQDLGVWDLGLRARGILIYSKKGPPAHAQQLWRWSVLEMVSLQKPWPSLPVFRVWFLGPGSSNNGYLDPLASYKAVEPCHRGPQLK